MSNNAGAQSTIRYTMMLSRIAVGAALAEAASPVALGALRALSTSASASGPLGGGVGAAPSAAQQKVGNGVRSIMWREAWSQEHGGNTRSIHPAHPCRRRHLLSTRNQTCTLPDAVVYMCACMLI